MNGGLFKVKVKFKCVRIIYLESPRGRSLRSMVNGQSSRAGIEAL